MILRPQLEKRQNLETMHSLVHLRTIAPSPQPPHPLDLLHSHPFRILTCLLQEPHLLWAHHPNILKSRLSDLRRLSVIYNKNLVSIAQHLPFPLRNPLP